MNAKVALLILGLTCDDPALTFRDFYAQFYVSDPEPKFWAAQRGEPVVNALARLTEAMADYADYRAHRTDLRCKQ